MLRKTPALLILILLVSLFASFGCGGDDENEKSSNETSAQAISPLKLIPQKANMLVYIDMAQLLEDQDLSMFYNSLPKEELEIPQTYDDLSEMVGGNSAQGVLFADISSMAQAVGSSEEGIGDEGYLGLVVKGIKDKEGLMALIESAADEPLSTITYKDFQIYTDPSQEMGFSFVGDDGLVFGSMLAVKDVLDIQKGEQPAITGPLLKAYNDLGKALVKLVMAVPPGAMGDGLQDLESEAPIDLAMFADLETVSLTVDKDDEELPIELRLCFADTESAENIKGFLSIVLQQFLGSGSIEIPEDAQALVAAFKDMDVSRDGACVEISIDLPISVIIDLAQGFDLSESIPIFQ